MSCQMKVIKKRNLDLDSCKKLLNEVTILKEFDHPNLVKILDLFQDDDSVYIVEELFHGKELLDLIEKKHMLNEAFVCNIVNQVLQALAYCHGQNVIHRDVRPENILIEEGTKGLVFMDTSLVRVKLVNFGCATTINPG